MPRNNGPSALTAQNQQDLISEGIENFELPKSVVTKIAKSALPENVKLQKETVISLVKGSTVFINYLAATAHDLALQKAHKSVSASDVLRALELLEFGDLVEPLTAELNIFRGGPAKTDKNRRSSTATTINTYSSATTGGKGKAPPGTAAASGNKTAATAPAGRTAGKGKAREDAVGGAGVAASASGAALAGAVASISTGYPASEDVDMDANDIDAAIMDAAGVGEEHARDLHEDTRLAGEEAYAREAGYSPPPAASYSQDADMNTEDADDMDTEAPEDIMAVEEEELRQDARGVEERDQA
ncbi:histone-fold-containing protein [Schizophyllum amplum]|uniref:DNA polymerase epsilon subunit D n=1 Tax=Schizophyllum amplum TaxID=97359 RepID=A0A550C8J2_9AGAR|nr:histone-fold-containing protein [Auriculariopsis ampla]